ncbi:MAG: hypothetical protein RLZZ546_1387 [Bacteroidota bacterium]|jgi:hypothetical protein
MQKIIIIIFLTVFNYTIVHSQKEITKLKFSFSYGLGTVGIKLLHNQKIDSGPSTTNNSYNYSFGIQSPLYKNISIRTELGYLSTFAFIDTEFNYKNGSNNVQQRLQNSTHNQKIHLGISPNFSIMRGKTEYDLYFGLHLANDLSFAMSESNILLPQNPMKLGFSIGNSLTLNLTHNIDFQCRLAYLTFQSSKILHSNWPSIQYHHILTSVAIGYRI